jgi:hypothetical protein
MEVSDQLHNPAILLKVLTAKEAKRVPQQERPKTEVPDPAGNRSLVLKMA